MSTFKVGDRIKVSGAQPPGHVRTPQFLRGKTGIIIRHFGAYPNPERLAYGMSGLPKLDLFQVKFDMEQVWSGDGQYNPRDTVTADIYENWLEPIEDQ